jgi:tRNA threonylcarbamoyladenosine modification (KEOPS) complex Cgi121 subunit
MAKTLKEGGKFIIKLAASELTIPELIKRSDGIHGVIQFFDPSAIISPNHLEYAYLNAVYAFKGGTSTSKGLRIEMLLYAALTRQIGDAIKIVGAKSEKEILVFASDEMAFNCVKKFLKKIQEFKPDRNHASAASKLYGFKTVPKDMSLRQWIAISGFRYQSSGKRHNRRGLKSIYQQDHPSTE